MRTHIKLSTALRIIFSKNEKPIWYTKMPLRRRFKAWSHSLANPFLVLRIWFNSRY